MTTTVKVLKTHEPSPAEPNAARGSSAFRRSAHGSRYRYGEATATLPVGRLNGSKINRHFHEGTHPKEHGTERDGLAAANAGSAIQLAGDAPALLLPIPQSKAPVQSRYAD